ncbi:IS200/IS605 family transposase, partial [Okeania sp. SIO3I5]|uniref:IS200/IS605 family transposase n=1 Tax=Okeania sp. SIO3I5 TaxID=2607805 RepID=UPI0025D2337B
YSLTVHIVFVTKYRKKVIASEILPQLHKIFDETCQKWECELVEFNGEADHVHLLITFNPKVQLSKFIANLKTVSSRLIRRDFADYLGRFYRKSVLWTGSYFVASCGGVTIEQLKQYVQHQSIPV